LSISNTRDEIDDEISKILASDFAIAVTGTSSVPHSGDPAITFPNLDDRFQRCEVIETAVLYVDIRRSTNLNLEHHPQTVAKLYSAFVRAMTRCAAEYRGHVRGIIGDRVMVLFNPSAAFTDAVNTAILMNTICKHVLNKHFKQNEVTCGIGIDYGRMLATKTGVRRHGYERHNYRSLVWLGRPANVASKLTDLANKTTHHSQDIVREARVAPPPALGLLSSLGPVNSLAAAFARAQAPGAAMSSGSGFMSPLAPFGLGQAAVSEWIWEDVELKEFVGRLKLTYGPGASPITHQDPSFRSFYLSTKERTTSAPPILMTKTVYDGFRKANPHCNSVQRGWWQPVSLYVPGYSGGIFGGNLIFPN
jgi:adenylate cyclase